MLVQLRNNIKKLGKSSLVQLCLFGLAGTFTVSANAELTLPKLQQQLAEHTLVRGDFTQTRSMEMFSEPLVSQGEFLLTQQQGLLWQQTLPFPVKLTLTADKLSQQFGDQPAQVMSASDNPMVFYFSHVFLSLFKGDTSQLTEQFQLTLSKKNSAWQLVLVPKSAPLNAVFRDITIIGDQHINQLRLNEVRGDNTLIDFSHQRTTPVVLSAEEQSAFKL